MRIRNGLIIFEKPFKCKIHESPSSLCPCRPCVRGDDGRHDRFLQANRRRKRVRRSRRYAAKGFVTLGVQGRKAVLRLELKGVSACLGEVPLSTGETLLSLSSSSDGLQYRFFADGREVGTLDTSLLSTEVVGGFTGVTIGLYAVGGKASFSYFDYKE